MYILIRSINSNCQHAQWASFTIKFKRWCVYGPTIKHIKSAYSSEDYNNFTNGRNFKSLFQWIHHLGPFSFQYRPLIRWYKDFWNFCFWKKTTVILRFNLRVEYGFFYKRFYYKSFLACLVCFISTIFGTNSQNSADVPLSNKQTNVRCKRGQGEKYLCIRRRISLEPVNRFWSCKHH